MLQLAAIIASVLYVVICSLIYELYSNQIIQIKYSDLNKEFEAYKREMTEKLEVKDQIIAYCENDIKLSKNRMREQLATKDGNIAELTEKLASIRPLSSRQAPPKAQNFLKCYYANAGSLGKLNKNKQCLSGKNRA
jgi:hypothetical protein